MGDSRITDYFCLFSERDICSLPLETPCEHTDPRPNWYYDSDVGVCKEVPDGGCNNNENNFESREACEAFCSRDRELKILFCCQHNSYFVAA